MIGDVALYSVLQEEWCYDAKLLPAIVYLGFVNYLVFGASPCYSMEDMKAYEGLEAYCVL